MMVIGRGAGYKMGWALVVALLVVAAPGASRAAISCGTVSKNLAGCVGYLKGGAGPSPTCCGGVRSLSSMGKTPADHRAACACLKQSAGSIKDLNFRNAAGLPAKCGVRVPYPISPDTDCSRIHF